MPLKPVECIGVRIAKGSVAGSRVGFTRITPTTKVTKCPPPPAKLDALPESFVLFGAGAGGLEAIEELKSLGRTPHQVFDNNSSKWGTHIAGVEVCQPRETDDLVLIASIFAADIASQLRDMRNEYIYFGPAFERKNYFGPVDAANERYLKELFGDEESAEALDGLLRFRQSLDPLDLPKMSYEQYLHPSIRPHSGEHVVDAGAWEGDTALLALREVGPDGFVTCFEPYGPAAACIPRADNVTVHELGLWSIKRRAQLYLSTTNSTANSVDLMATRSADDVRAQSIDLVPLDAIDLRRVDIIKMDIEGSERPALLGAKETIQRDRPRLMISGYHRSDDLWEIPRLIGSIAPYEFFLGHHTQYAFETVIYANPR